MTNPITICGSWWPAIVLRQFTPQDYENLRTLVMGNRAHLRPMQDVHCLTGRELEDWLQATVDGSDPSRTRFGVWHKGALVGEISLDCLREGFSTVGYWVGKEHTRQGIATSALISLSRYVFSSTKEETLRATVNKENVASQKVLGRAGFHIEVHDDTQYMVCRLDKAKKTAAT